MSKECKLSNDAFSQTVFQLSATCIWTKIFNLKNILFNKWIALDSRTCLYISSPKNIKQMIYNVWPLQKTLWNIDIHTCLLDRTFLCPHLPSGNTCIVLSKNWKMYWSEQKFIGLGPEDRCSSWGLLVVLETCYVLLVWAGGLVLVVRSVVVPETCYVLLVLGQRTGAHLEDCLLF